MEQLAAIGCSGEEIAAVVGCHRDTIYARFSDSIKEGHEKRNASVRRAQYEAGVKNKNVAMLIWLGKQHLGQKDQIVNENTGKMTHEHRDADEEDILLAADEIRRKREFAESVPSVSNGLH